MAVGKEKVKRQVWFEVKLGEAKPIKVSSVKAGRNLWFKFLVDDGYIALSSKEYVNPNGRVRVLSR